MKTEKINSNSAISFYKGMHVLIKKSRKQILSIFLIPASIAVFSSPEILYAKTETAVHRYALIAGANNGGPGRPLLKYAVSDAYAFLNVMKGLGGVNPDRSILLVDPDARSFLRALDNAENTLSQERSRYKRIELIFYYSGHSDEHGILLGKEKIPYIEIRKRIEKMKADVKIAILDSCSSGAFTRTKGGIMRSPFLVDSSNDMKGFAFMTSSSSDEASQESDKIQGSFFTHFLITGLRGAADMSRDGRITLNEAYQFAYNETLSRTEKTMAGAQHPNYNIQMNGTGDVIMTDIRKSSTALVLNRNISGKIYIHDSDNILVAELTKPFGIETELGLGSGKYRIVNDNFSSISESEIDLSGTKKVMLAQNDMKSGEREKTSSRGDAKASEKSSGEKSVLISKGNFKPGGYQSIIPKFTKLGNEYSFMAGTRISFILNDTFALGTAAFGLFYPRDRSVIDKQIYTGEKPNLFFAYGGLMFEYFLFPRSLFTVSIGMLLGAGGAAFISPGEYVPNPNFDHVDFYFVMEPEIGVFVNITKYSRIGISGTYRYLSGNNLGNLSAKNMSDFSLTLHVQFGWF